MPHQNTFVDNEIKAFVHTIFGYYDKHVPVDKILDCFAKDENLVMKLPNNEYISTHDKFEEWYDIIRIDYHWNIHWIERVDVKMLDNYKYQVDLVLLWEALSKDNKHSAHRVSQEWVVIEEDQPPKLKIQSYIVTKFDQLATAPPIL